MSYIQKVLKKEILKYPKMEVQDVLKLIYQSEFGCGHLIENEEKSFTMLLQEWEQEEGKIKEDLFEEINPTYTRFNIRAAKALGVSSKLFQDIFLNSVTHNDGSIEGFYYKVKELKKYCIKGELPFQEKEIDSFLAQWEEGGRPLFRHSNNYRKLYKPSYRVVLKEFEALLPIFMKIESEVKLNHKVIIGIDGPCGAGKTTLANKLANFYGVQVIRMDDFFLIPTLRTKERLEEVGGNIHYERFYEEVASKINTHKEFEYRVFDCRKMDFKDTIKIINSNVVIIEGSYSMHPLYSSIYDIKVFCDINPELQRSRIINRNGIGMYKNFESKWIPMENRYFEGVNIKENCDFIIDN